MTSKTSTPSSIFRPSTCSCGGNALGDTSVCDTCGGSIAPPSNRGSTKAKSAKIKWKACGFDNADRVGTVGLKEEIQIRYSRGKHDVCFINGKKASFDDLDLAKAFAEENITTWQAERAAYQAEQARAAQERQASLKAASERQASLIGQLEALGIAATESYGTGVQLSPEAAEQVVRRLMAQLVQPQLILCELAQGSEMRHLMAC